MIFMSKDRSCHASLLEKYLLHHGHKGDTKVILRICGTIGERAQVSLV